MKKWKRLLLTGIAACTTMVMSASAASFEQAADALKAMGLFAGTSTGYELDRAPTRAEAATMLVRLLGKTAEAEALWASGSASFVFRDMDDFDWAQPYVHWLSRSGLAAGTSADRFSPSAPCTAQMYAAFLLRALGYSETAGDFTFDNAISFARSHGVINSANYDPSVFLRDHVVAASYTALAAATKGGEDDLLTKLVRDGAVSQSAASAALQEFSDYRGYARVMQAVPDGIAMQNVTSFSASGGLTLDIAAVSEAKMRGNAMSSKSSLTITLPGENPFVQERNSYFAVGRWYTNVDGAKTWRALGSMPAVRPEAVPLVLIDEIRAENAEYILAYNAAGRAYYQAQLWQLLQTGAPALRDLTITGLNSEVRVKDGALAALSTGITASATLENSTVNIRAQQSSSISETGNGVSVTVPEGLSTYTQAT